MSADAARELATCLGPMVARLPSPYREAVTLVDLEGIPQKEAALRAGLSLSGMKSRVQRGRQALEQLVHDCCQIELDATGRIMDYQLRGQSADRRAPVAALPPDPLHPHRHIPTIASAASTLIPASPANTGP